MKKILLLLILLSGISCFGQSGKALYKVYSISKDGSEKLLNGVEFELVFNEKEYVFKRAENLDSDGLPMKQKIVNRRADVGVFYRNLINGEKFVQLDFMGFPIVRKDTLLDDHWNLTNKSKIIANYDCKSANITSTNEYNGAKFYTEAWYSPEVSFPYGPNGFDGLPGLIVSLETLNLKYVMYKVKFSDKDIEIKIPEGRPMSNDEILSLMAEKTGAKEEDLRKFFSTNHSEK